MLRRLASAAKRFISGSLSMLTMLLVSKLDLEVLGEARGDFPGGVLLDNSCPVVLRRLSSAEELPFMLFPVPAEIRRPPLPPEELESGLFRPKLSPEMNLRSGVLPRKGLIEFRSVLFRRSSRGIDPRRDPALLPS